MNGFLEFSNVVVLQAYCFTSMIHRALPLLLSVSDTNMNTRIASKVYLRFPTKGQALISTWTQLVWEAKFPEYIQRIHRH